MSTFGVLLNVHLISIALSVGLLMLRFWWRYTDSCLACARWTRIVPPVVDTVLLLSGVALMVKAHILPFTEHGTWLTESCLGLSFTSFWVLLRSIIVGRAVSRRD